MEKGFAGARKRELLELVILGSLLDPLLTGLASPGNLTTNTDSHPIHIVMMSSNLVSPAQSPASPLVFPLRFLRQQFSL